MKDRYIAPEFYVVEYAIEEGFSVSDVEAPDFEDENEL